MGRMLKFELRKLLRKKSFYLMFILCVGVAVYNVFYQRNMIYDIVQEINEFNKESIRESLAEMFSPQRLALSGFWLMVPIVLAVFAGIFVCEDRASGTIKNIYSRGYSRTTVFFSKFIVSSAVSVLLYVVLIAGLYLSGMVILSTAPVDVSPQTIKGFWLLILGRLLIVLTANAAYFMLSELIGGSTGGAIAVNIFAPIVMTGVLSIGLNIIFLSGTEDYEVYEKMSNIISSIMEYWIYSLTMEGFNIGMEPDAYVWHLVAAAIYFIVFMGLSWLISVKKEIKN